MSGGVKEEGREGGREGVVEVRGQEVQMKGKREGKW